MRTYADGIGLLATWLCAFPDALHPQMDVDADRDADVVQAIPAELLLQWHSEA